MGPRTQRSHKKNYELYVLYVNYAFPSFFLNKMTVRIHQNFLPHEIFPKHWRFWLYQKLIPYDVEYNIRYETLQHTASIAMCYLIHLYTFCRHALISWHQARQFSITSDIQHITAQDSFYQKFFTFQIVKNVCLRISNESCRFGDGHSQHFGNCAPSINKIPLSNVILNQQHSTWTQNCSIK